MAARGGPGSLAGSPSAAPSEGAAGRGPLGVPVALAAGTRLANAGPETPQGWETNAWRLEKLVRPPHSPWVRPQLEDWIRVKLRECWSSLFAKTGRGKNPTQAQQDARTKSNQLSRDAWFATREAMIENFVEALSGAARRERGLAVGNHIMCLLRDFVECRLSFEELCGYAEVYAATHGAG